MFAVCFKEPEVGLSAGWRCCNAFCRRVRTTDSISPVISELTATFTPPMSLTLTYTVSKAGSLWLAPRRAGLPEPTAQEVLAAVATRSTASANFTAAVTVATAATSTTQTLCVADGDKLVVYAVARDTEGLFPGRQDNTSPLKRYVLEAVPSSVTVSGVKLCVAACCKLLLGPLCFKHMSHLRLVWPKTDIHSESKLPQVLTASIRTRIVMSMIMTNRPGRLAI